MCFLKYLSCNRWQFVNVKLFALSTGCNKILDFHFCRSNIASIRQKYCPKSAFIAMILTERASKKFAYLKSLHYWRHPLLNVLVTVHKVNRNKLKYSDIVSVGEMLETTWQLWQYVTWCDAKPWSCVTWLVPSHGSYLLIYWHLKVAR